MQQTFEKQRAILLDSPEVPPLNVGGYLPLAAAISQKKILPEQQVLLAHVGKDTITLPMLSMVYHHVAQGTLGDVPWMAAFCCLCNGGSVFSPTQGAGVYTFAAQGYYDAMILLADQETGSFWNHLNGTCLYGPALGATLKRTGTLQQMDAASALRAYPDAQLARPESLHEAEMATAIHWDAIYRQAAEPALDDELLATLSPIDTRLHSYEMGLGLWTLKTRRFYPITQLYKQQNVILDQIEGRGVVILFNELIGLPVAFYLETKHVSIERSRIAFSETTYYQDNILYIDGQKVKPEAPPHAAIRWYGFSSVFPGCDIYRSNA